MLQPMSVTIDRSWIPVSNEASMLMPARAAALCLTVTKNSSCFPPSPKDLHGRLQAHADMRDGSVDWLVTKAVKQFLEGLRSSREQVEVVLRASLKGRHARRQALEVGSPLRH